MKGGGRGMVIEKYGEEEMKGVVGGLEGVYKVEVRGGTGMEWGMV